VSLLTTELQDARDTGTLTIQRLVANKFRKAAERHALKEKQAKLQAELEFVTKDASMKTKAELRRLAAEAEERDRLQAELDDTRAQKVYLEAEIRRLQTEERKKADHARQCMEANSKKHYKERGELAAKLGLAQHEIAEKKRLTFQLSLEINQKGAEVQHLTRKCNEVENRHVAQGEDMRKAARIAENSRLALITETEKREVRLKQETAQTLAVMQSKVLKHRDARNNLENENKKAHMKIATLQLEVQRLHEAVKREQGVAALRVIKQGMQEEVIHQRDTLRKVIVDQSAQVKAQEAKIESVEGMYHALLEEKMEADAIIMTVRKQVTNEEQRRKKAEAAETAAVERVSEVKAEMEANPSAPMGGEPIHVYLEKLVAYKVRPIMNAIAAEQQAAGGKFMGLGERQTKLEASLGSMNGKISGAEERVASKVAAQMESRLNSTLSRLKRQVDTVSDRANAQAEKVNTATVKWAAKEEELRDEVGGRVEACQEMLLSRSEHTKEAIREEGQQRESLRVWIANQIEIASGQFTTEVERQALAAQGGREALAKRHRSREEYFREEANETKRAIEERAQSLEKELQTTLELCRQEMQEQERRFRGVESQTETLASNIKRELARSQTGLESELAALKERFNEALQREAANRRAWETTAMQKQSQLEASRMQVDRDTKLAVQSVKEQYVALESDLKSQIERVERRMNDSCGPAQQELIESELRECQDALTQQSAAISDMCGGTASSMERTSMVFDSVHRASNARR